MKDLIEALTIFSKYIDTDYPTGSEHEVLYVYCDPKLVSVEDTKKLARLGFEPTSRAFASVRFGS